MPYGPSHFISPSKGDSQQVTELDLRYCPPCAGLGKNLISALAQYSPPQSDIWLHSEANGIEPSEPVICIGSSQGPRTTPSNASVCCCFLIQYTYRRYFNVRWLRLFASHSMPPWIGWHRSTWSGAFWGLRESWVKDTCSWPWGNIFIWFTDTAVYHFSYC